MIQASQLLFPDLPLARACQLLGINRGSYYRTRGEPVPTVHALALREAIVNRRTLLRDDLPGALGKEWDELCAHAGELVNEVNRLDQQHTGQLAQLEATLGSLQEAVLLIDAHNYVLLAIVVALVPLGTAFTFPCVTSLLSRVISS